MSPLDYAYMGDCRQDGAFRVFVWVSPGGYFGQGYYMQHTFKKARAARRFLRITRRNYAATQEV